MCAIELWTHTATRSKVFSPLGATDESGGTPKMGEVSQNWDYRLRDTGMRFKAQAGETSSVSPALGGREPTPGPGRRP